MLIPTLLILCAVSVRAVRRRRSNTRSQGSFDSLVETIDLLLASLRAGYSLPQSVLLLADVAPISVRLEFRALRNRVAEGHPISSAIRESCSLLDPSFRHLFELVISSIRLGIPTESLIMQIQSETRHIRRQQGEARARQLSVRLTLPVVLCTLPSFLFLIIVPMVAGTITHLRLNGSGS